MKPLTVAEALANIRATFAPYRNSNAQTHGEAVQELMVAVRAEETTKLCNLIERLEKRIPAINRNYADAYGDGRTDGMNVVLDALKHFVNIG